MRLEPATPGFQAASGSSACGKQVYTQPIRVTVVGIVWCVMLVHHAPTAEKLGVRVDRQVIPLRARKIDIGILAFFLLNLLFITYVVDLEQLVIANPYHFTYPLWPPRLAVDAIHWWGGTFDHDLMARQAWWKMTIWIDNLGFGPFYVVAIYAYLNGKEWIRVPSIIYASMLLTNVLIILAEESAGAYASPNLPMVLLANLPWLVFPIIIIARMYAATHPFTRPVAASVALAAARAAPAPLVTPAGLPAMEGE